MEYLCQILTNVWSELKKRLGDFLLIGVDMGMITRVRGRLRSFHNIHKLDPEERDEKIAETGKFKWNKGILNTVHLKIVTLYKMLCIEWRKKSYPVIHFLMKIVLKIIKIKY